MAVLYPVIGQWFRRRNGVLFEVVALDEEDGTIERLHWSGAVADYSGDFPQAGT